MHEFACYNYEILAASSINLPAVSQSALYGRGIFTTIAVFDSKAFQWELHWRRIIDAAKITGVDLTEFIETEVHNALSTLIAKNDLKTGRIRLTFFDVSGGGIWGISRNRKTAFLMTSADFRNVSDRICVTVSPYPVNSSSPLASIKTCNYLENLLAKEEASRRGFDEAIRLNEKIHIASATMANIFWARGGQIFTPPDASGIIAGTTREFVIQNFPVREEISTLNELASADEIFLTSAGIGIVSVGILDDVILKRFEITDEIKNLYRKKTFEVL